MARWRERNIDAIREYARRYGARPDVRQRINEKQRERRARDPEAYRAYMREYYVKRRALRDNEQSQDEAP
jgi:hypothetical protein